MAVRIRNIQISCRVEVHIEGTVQPRRRGSAAIPRESTRSSPSKRSNDACRRSHLADSVVPSVGNIEVPGGVNGSAMRTVQLSRCRRAIVAIDADAAE